MRKKNTIKNRCTHPYVESGEETVRNTRDISAYVSLPYKIMQKTGQGLKRRTAFFRPDSRLKTQTVRTKSGHLVTLETLENFHLIKFSRQ